MILSEFVEHIKERMLTQIESENSVSILAPAVFLSADPQHMADWVVEMGSKRGPMSNHSMERAEKLRNTDGVLMVMNVEGITSEKGMDALLTVMPAIIGGFKIEAMIWGASAFTMHHGGTVQTEKDALAFMQKMGRDWQDEATEVLYIMAVDREVRQCWSCNVIRGDDGEFVTATEWVIESPDGDITGLADAAQTAMRG